MNSLTWVIRPKHIGKHGPGLKILELFYKCRFDIQKPVVETITELPFHLVFSLQEYQTIKPPTVDNHFSHEILGENLKPGTTYVVSVKSILLWNNRSSDSSDEYEFTTRKYFDLIKYCIFI